MSYYFDHLLCGLCYYQETIRKCMSTWFTEMFSFLIIKENRLKKVDVSILNFGSNALIFFNVLIS